jgi:hypothetical protein
MKSSGLLTVIPGVETLGSDEFESFRKVYHGLLALFLEVYSA